MPGFDGTGPFGRGVRGGRGPGPCRGARYASFDGTRRQHSPLNRSISDRTNRSRPRGTGSAAEESPVAADGGFGGGTVPQSVKT